MEFGMMPDEVRALLGKPTLCWTDATGDKRAIYDKPGMALDYSAEEEFRLTAIQVLAPNATLDRNRLASMSQEQIRRAFEKHGFVFFSPESGFGGQEEWWTSREGPGSLILRFDDRGHFLAVIVIVTLDDDGSPVWHGDGSGGTP